METTLTNLSLNDIKEFKLSAFKDHRGEIFTVYEKPIDGMDFWHDKVCIRYKNCLVGIHGDFKTWKLVTCLYGNVFCALVDNRKESQDYNKHRSYVLNDENKKQLLIPPGIGNSFLVLSDICVYNYKLSYSGKYVDCDEQFTLKWNDPKYGIKWGIDCPIISKRDSGV